MVHQPWMGLRRSLSRFTRVRRAPLRGQAVGGECRESKQGSLRASVKTPSVALTVGVVCAAGSLSCTPAVELQDEPAPKLGRQSFALTGDQVRKLVLPDDILCPSNGFAHVAISMAAIPGDIAAPGNADLADRSVLATSCRNGVTPEIFLVDPGDPALENGPGTPEREATRVREIVPTLDGVTPFTPPIGWGSLAYRADVNPPDLLACANPADSSTPHEVYSIDIETGQARFLFEGAQPTDGLPYCDGLAWDSWNDVVWTGSDISDTVYRFHATNAAHTAWAEIPAPDTAVNSRVFPDGVRRFTINHLTAEGVSCFLDDTTGRSGKSGIEVLGPNQLLLACNGQERMFIVQQSDFALVDSFTTDAGRAEDLECDRRTFGSANLPLEDQKSVVWTKDAFDEELFAVEVPDNTCGLCRPTERRRLSELTFEERQNLASLIEEYITAERVGIHHLQISTWHTSSGFFPGHRGYIGGLEVWLYNVVRTSGDPRYSENFFPLPKWDPGEPFPDVALPAAEVPFLAVDTEACLDSGAPADRLDCDDHEVNPPQVALPAQFRSPAQGGTMCTSFPLDPDDRLGSIEAVRTGGLEGPYHGNAIHCGFPAQTFDRSTMCEVYVSPSAVIFWPWHAFVDDVSRDYECNCASEPCEICTDVFRPFVPTTTALRSFQSLSGGTAAPPPPLHWDAPIGFWWWFEDFIMPPAVRPLATVDHSGFDFQARLRGSAKIVSGHVGQAIELDGKLDFLEVENRSVGEIGAHDFSLDAWVNTASLDFQGIIDKRNRHGDGYALYLDEGELGFAFGTGNTRAVHQTESVQIADGEWHHVAAVVDRSAPDGSGLFVDGQLVLGFDATAVGNLIVGSELWLGRARVDDQRPAHGVGSFGPFSHAQCSSRDKHHPFRPRHRKGHHSPSIGHGHKKVGFLEGRLDEVSLVRHALSRDLVAAIYAAGSAGKFGSMGNLPTFVDGAPCLEQLGDAIASDPAAAFLQPAFTAVLEAIRARRLRSAKALLEVLHDLAELASADANWETGGMVFHRIHGLASLCAEVPPLGSPRFSPGLP